MSNVYIEGTDTGYIFSGPCVEEKKKIVKKGTLLIDNHRTGVIFSENPNSPWHQATIYSHGSIMKDSEGEVIQEVALCETTDADGDLTWSILWRPPQGPVTLHFVVGTGKWEGITGKGRIPGTIRDRADDHVMPKYEIQWKVDMENSGKIESLVKKGAYTDHATSLILLCHLRT